MKEPPAVSRPDSRLVWDLPVRLGHWLLVTCVAGSWLTHQAGIEWFAWHRRFGYAALVLVLFRIAWGFVGTRHARFANFVAGPPAIVAYLRGGARDEAVGHNPLGALSIVAMLVLLLLQAATGLFANDEIANAGPFYGWVAHETSNRITALHHANFDWLLALIVLHVAAVAWHVRMRRSALIRAMVTGRKDAGQVPVREAITGSRLPLAAAIVVVLVVALALAIRAAPEAAIALF
ncbi:MAG: cytochrome b/b6 domain-containing protein [Steroidobacteraceae bacterium]